MDNIHVVQHSTKKSVNMLNSFALKTSGKRNMYVNATPTPPPTRSVVVPDIFKSFSHRNSLQHS